MKVQAALYSDGRTSWPTSRHGISSKALATLRRLLGAPSSVKAWVDHLIAVGLSFDPETRAPLLGGREFVVLVSRGGATPKAHPDTGGTTLNHAFRTPSRSPARNRASSHRAHPRPHRPGHGRTDSTGRAESHRGRARHRRSVDPGTRTGIRHPRGGTSTEVTPTPHTVSDAALAPASGTLGGAYHGAGPAAADGAPVARRGDRVEIWNPGGARAGNSAGAGQNLPFVLQEPWTGSVTGPARGPHRQRAATHTPASRGNSPNQADHGTAGEQVASLFSNVLQGRVRLPSGRKTCAPKTAGVSPKRRRSRALPPQLVGEATGRRDQIGVRTG